MPNIAAALKAEITRITRITRKTIRDDTSGLKKAIAPYRSEIAALKRRIKALEQQLRRYNKAVARVAEPPQAKEPTSLRFSAKGFASHRQRLGLSQKDFGALIGASALSVWKWEQGEVRPRQRYLAAIAEVRGIGRKEALARLHGQGG